jgi:hypothetical protein
VAAIDNRGAVVHPVSRVNDAMTSPAIAATLRRTTGRFVLAKRRRGTDCSLFASDGDAVVQDPAFRRQ